MQRVRATLFEIMLSAIMRIDMCAGPCRGEVAAWDVYMDAMSSIGAIVPWMLTEGVYFLLSCHLSFPILECFLCSSMICHCLTCNDIQDGCLCRTTRGIAPSRGTGTTTQRQTLAVSSIPATCSLAHHL